MSDIPGLVRTRPMALDHETSGIAAAKARRTVSILQTQVLGLLARHKCGLIDEHIVEAYNAHQFLNPSLPKATPQAIRTARAGLCRLGFVVDSKRRGRTALDNPAVIWTVRGEEDPGHARPGS
jgi:hypothetical protein